MYTPKLICYFLPTYTAATKHPAKWRSSAVSSRNGKPTRRRSILATGVKLLPQEYRIMSPVSRMSNIFSNISLTVFQSGTVIA